MQKLISIWFVIFFINYSFSQGKSNIESNKSSSFSNSFNKTDNFILKNIESNNIPGGVFIIALKGKIIYYKNFGLNDSIAFQKEDIFRIASMTKAITVTGIMQLVEQGKINLDDPVSKYIPSFKNTKVLNKFNPVDSSFTTTHLKNTLTIQNLLTHTSGIYYGDFEKDSLLAIYKKNKMLGLGLSSNTYSTQEMVDKIAKLPLAFQPGTSWKYGLNMEVLGRIIEVVSHQTLAEYFDENIFSPLGMNDTYFYLPKEKQNRLVKMYYPDSLNRIKYKPIMDYPKLPDHNHYAGGGGLSSTALDYAKFGMALANNGILNGQRILKEKTVKELYTNRIENLDKEKKGFSKISGVGFGYGFGVILEKRPLLWPFNEGTYFWSGYFNTKFWVDPEEDLVFVGMTQIYGFQHKKFWSKLYKEIYKDLKHLPYKKLEPALAN